MQPHDIDWEKISEDWDENGFQSVICRLSAVRDRKRSARIQRKTIIRGDGL
jgi:hypothetical protein